MFFRRQRHTVYVEEVRLTLSELEVLFADVYGPSQGPVLMGDIL